MQSTYSALTGQEIRKITKATINEEVDKLKYLSAGNSFHRAQVQFGFTMTAYPADVPVPEKEFEFEIDAKTATSTEALKQFQKVEDLDSQIAILQQQKEQIENLILEAQTIRGTLVQESEVHLNIDGSIPDQARITHGLDVPVIEKGKETMVPAAKFVPVFKKTNA